jgi:hypothetical protein
VGLTKWNPPFFIGGLEIHHNVIPAKAGIQSADSCHDDSSNVKWMSAIRSRRVASPEKEGHYYYGDGMG